MNQRQTKPNQSNCDEAWSELSIMPTAPSLACPSTPAGCTQNNSNSSDALATTHRSTFRIQPPTPALNVPPNRHPHTWGSWPAVVAGRTRSGAGRSWGAGRGACGWGKASHRASTRATSAAALCATRRSGHRCGDKRFWPGFII